MNEHPDQQDDRAPKWAERLLYALIAFGLLVAAWAYFVA